MTPRQVSFNIHLFEVLTSEALGIVELAERVDLGTTILFESLETAVQNNVATIIPKTVGILEVSVQALPRLSIIL